MRTTKTLIVLLAAVGLLIAACEPAATPTSQPAQPTATSASEAEKGSKATTTPALTKTPVPPTATPVPPTATTAPPTNTPAPPTPTEPPKQADGPQVVGPCYNPYYPIREGVTWTYRSQSPVSSMEEYSLTYSDVVANGFRAHHAYPELKVETQWICSDSGLVSAQFAQLAMSQMSDVEFEQLEFSGVTLPPAAQWKVGFAWDSAYQMTGKMTLEGIGPVTTQFDIAATNEIAAQEEVTVPAGIYPDAMRVDSNTTIVITGKAGDLEIPPINFEFTNSNWHVKDVGLVRTEMVDQMGTFISELLSVE